MQSLAREQASAPFALDVPPLLRLVLVREAADRHTLIVTIHHLVCDSWSMDVFYADLADAYRGLRGAARLTSVSLRCSTPTMSAGWTSRWPGNGWTS